MSNSMYVAEVGEFITQTEWLSISLLFWADRNGWVPVLDSNGNKIALSISIKGADSSLCYLYYKITKPNGDPLSIYARETVNAEKA